MAESQAKSDPNESRQPAADAAEALDAAQSVIGELAKEVDQAAMNGQPVPVELPSFGENASGLQTRALELLSDVNLQVKIELGRTRMLVEDVLRLGEGAVVELDKLAGDPVDVYVNGRHVARGEVLVLNDNFCVRINEILKAAPSQESSSNPSTTSAAA